MHSLDPVVLARLQFAANITFHILFPTISLAMGWFYCFLKLDLSQLENHFGWMHTSFG